jgi:hypothetical protein
MSEINDHSNSRSSSKKKKTEEYFWKSLPTLKGEDRIEALNYLGHKAYDREDFASAAIFAEETAATWLKVNATLNAVMAYLNAGLSWLCANDNPLARENMIHAQNLLDGIVIQDSTGHFRQILGERFLDLSEFNSALEQFELAASAFESSSDMHRVAHVLQLISQTYLKMTDGTKAFAAIDSSLSRVTEKEFKPCCIGIALQWVDLSVKFEITDRVTGVLSEALENAEAFGDKDGLAQLKLRLAMILNKELKFEESLHIIAEIEKSKLIKLNQYFQAKVLLEKSKALFPIMHEIEAEKSINKARIIAKSISDVSIVYEVDDYALTYLLSVKQYEKAELLIRKLQSSQWYQTHLGASLRLEVWMAQVLYQKKNFSSCLKVLDQLLLEDLSHSQLLIVLAIRAHIVIDSKNGNLARVLVGKSIEIAEESKLEFAKLLFSLWNQVLEQKDIEEASEESGDLVNIFLSEDITALSRKSTELLLASFGDRDV